MGLRQVIRRHVNDRGEWFDQETWEESQHLVLPSGGYITRAAFIMGSGTVPYDDIYTPRKTVFAKTIIRCEWCGVKNKDDDPYCIGCGGPL